MNEFLFIKNLINKQVTSIKKISKNIIKVYIDKQKPLNLLIINKNDYIFSIIHINEFIKNLKRFKFSNNLINDILFVHWGDLTLNNQGNKRYPLSLIQKYYNNKIENINKQLNNGETLDKLIDYFMFFNEKHVCRIDGFINMNSKKIIYKDKIVSSLKKLKPNNLNINISNLTINNLKRNILFKKEYENKRNYVKLSFMGLQDFLDKIDC